MCILELLQKAYIEFISINHCLWNRRLIFVKTFHRNCNTWHGFSLFRVLLFDVFSSMRFPCFFDLRTSYLCLLWSVSKVFFSVLSGFHIQLSLYAARLFSVVWYQISSDAVSCPERVNTSATPLGNLKTRIYL